MTREKPPDKSWDVWIEQLIQEARDAGEFDRLEGTGKPIPGVEAPYDPDWWVKKLLEREKVSVLPPALELLWRVEAELARIWSARREDDVRARVEALNAEIARVNARVAAGPPTRLAPLDPDDVLREWRSRRA
jgi:DnaJ homologue, subfamily C, member 28, conserved domain